MTCTVEQLFLNDNRPQNYKKEWTTDAQAELLVFGPIKATAIRAILFRDEFFSSTEGESLIHDLKEITTQKQLSCIFKIDDDLFSTREYLINYSSTSSAIQYTDFLEEGNLQEAPLEDTVTTFDTYACDSNYIETGSTRENLTSNTYQWTITYRRPLITSEITNATLSTIAVVEKILNRGRITRLSEKLENRIKKLSTSEDEVSTNIELTHIIQSVTVELVKTQKIHSGQKICLNLQETQGESFITLGQEALADLEELGEHVALLYGCENPFSDLKPGTLSDADLIITLSDNVSDLEDNVVLISTGHDLKEAKARNFTRVQEPAPITYNFNSLRFLLNYIFRFDEFRPGQLQGITRTLERKDTIVLLPTGSGKSVIFQLLSFITPGISFVVCPINSLIEDQVDNLHARGIDRVVGLTGQSKNKDEILERISTGQYFICYVSPERFQMANFLDRVKAYSRSNIVSLIAIDEAHCVSEWGHDFRTSYLGLARSCRSTLKTGDAIPPLLALTGTASSSVLKDMQHDLEIDDNEAIIKPRTFDRAEIHYRVIEIPSEDKASALQVVVNTEIPRDFGVTREQFFKHESESNEDTNAGIVFCQNVNGKYGIMGNPRLKYPTVGVYDQLNELFPNECSLYCGSKPKALCEPTDWDQYKRDSAANFKTNKTSIMVATKAYGMGIDKPNVRWVIHYGMPSSLESYYQEVGRAARDKKEAYVYLLLSNDYPEINETLLDSSRIDSSNLIKFDEAEKGKWNGDDVSRYIFFHQQTFEGTASELTTASELLDSCTKDNFEEKQWHIPFTSNNKNEIERAIYRFCILGVFEEYTVSYGENLKGNFNIRPRKKTESDDLREALIQNYLAYVKAYQSDASYLKIAERDIRNAVANAKNDRDFIMRTYQHLLENFVYKVLEAGRRRATLTMLTAAEKAAAAGSWEAQDNVFREEILAYLSSGDTTGEGEIDLMQSIIYDATNLDNLLRAIGSAQNGEEQTNLSRQCLRLLEDYPQHFGLYFIVACLALLQGDRKLLDQSVSAVVHNGQTSYGVTPLESGEYFLSFLNSELSKPVTIANLDHFIGASVSKFGTTRDAYLKLLKLAQVKHIRQIDRIYTLSQLIQRSKYER